MSFIPSVTKAGFFSSFLGNEASANISNYFDSTQIIKNSQTLALLQADNSSVPSAQSKAEKSSEDQVNNDVNVNILSKNALLPTTNHLSILGESEAGDSYSDQISIYVVRKGDSISQIADMFNVSVSTILSANDLKKNSKIKEGDVLLILPISGIEHTVTKGQTLASIAKLYKVDISDIAQFNGMTSGTTISIGDKIMIPGADMSDEGGDKPAANLGTAVARDTNYYKTHPLRNLTGYFINPVPTGHKTQGLHGPGNRGIDIGAPTGTPIYASASGTVSLTNKGWSGGYGNMVIVNHPNGTKTLYAHMSKIGTTTGKSVAQGEIIGYVGSTGKSTGPHIHFEIFSARNPGADWSWAN